MLAIQVQSNRITGEHGPSFDVDPSIPSLNSYGRHVSSNLGSSGGVLRGEPPTDYAHPGLALQFFGPSKTNPKEVWQLGTEQMQVNKSTLKVPPTRQ